MLNVNNFVLELQSSAVSCISATPFISLQVEFILIVPGLFTVPESLFAVVACLFCLGRSKAGLVCQLPLHSQNPDHNRHPLMMIPFVDGVTCLFEHFLLQGFQFSGQHLFVVKQIQTFRTAWIAKMVF